LVVIAIIAILSAILFPAIRKGIQAAQKTRAASHMRQIILAYENYIQRWGGELGTIAIDPGGTAHDWIAVLAQKGYLNDPRLVAFDFDPLVKRHSAAGFFCHFFGVIPPQIWNNSSATFGDGFKDIPLSLCFITNLDSRKATAHTPLCWTRGLNASSGTWNSSEGSTGDGSDGGIWGNIGGLVGFIGGHVEWFQSLTSDEFSEYRATINNDAWVVDWKGHLMAFDDSQRGKSGDSETSPSDGGDSGGTVSTPPSR
jgi:type II secretory pathway pseudopilin PulG